MKELSKNRNFRLLVEATAVSSFGDSLYALAITLSVYHLTGSIFGIAIMWFIRAIIRIPCQFLAGVLIDRFDRRKISITVYFVSSILMFLFFLFEGKSILFAYFIIFILQGISDVDNMAQYGILQDIVEKEKLDKANSIFSFVGTVILLIGPGVGAVIYSLLSCRLLYLIDAFTFLLGALFISMLRYKDEKEAVEKKFELFTHAKRGISEIRKMPIIRCIMITTLFVGMLGRFFEINKVLVAENIFTVGDVGIVYFSYAMSIGSLIAPFLNSLLKRVRGKDVSKYIIVCIVMVTSFVTWGSTKNPVLSLTAVFLVGIAETLLSILMNIYFQREVDRSVFGFVMSAQKILMVLSATIGIILAPFLNEMLGIAMSTVLLGLGAMVALFILLFTSYRIRS